MKVLVTGGTGSLGRILVRALVREGHAVRIMSQRARRRPEMPDVEWAQADLASGEGVREAVEGVETVFHLASDFNNPEAVDVSGTRRLVEASREGRISHLVYISIVGIEDIPTNYYRRKREAERIIESSGVPHSIQRATQFHSFVGSLLSKAARVPFVLPLPANFKFQSIDEAEVAARLARCLADGPRGRLIDFGGPEVLTLDEMAEAWMEVNGIRKKLIRIPLPGAAAKALRAGKNTTPEGLRGMLRWREWLAGRVNQHAAPERQVIQRTT
ncbi:MAG TPA: NAD(P)H-binding protein [Pyrinomonadaceae bacterium]|nr:NAD(P)H-binding protein [Pyrinomonadaceae bacterium]